MRNEKMKKYYVFFSLLLVLLLFANMQTLNIGAQDINISDDFAACRDTEQQIIFDKIDQLGHLKAKAAIMRDRFNLDEHPEYKVESYEKILAEMEALRGELAVLGAVPSADVLDSFRFEQPMSVQGVWIDDFADFEETFGDVYELWGISQTVNASYGTYYTYDVVIQGAVGNDNLITHVEQNGMQGYDIYASGSNVLPLAVGELGNILFEKIAETTIDGGPVLSQLYNGAQILQTIQSFSDQVHANDPVSAGALGQSYSDDAVSASGLTQSYRIFCTANSTLHFIFVRDTAAEAWQHTFTTNTVSLLEYHQMYMTFNLGHGQIEAVSGNKDYSTTLFPTRWIYRLTNAVDAYQNNQSLYYDVIEVYDVDVTNSGQTRRAFSLDIMCPITQMDLCSLGFHETHHLCNSVIVLIVISLFIILTIVVLNVLHRKGRVWGCEPGSAAGIDDV